MLVGNHPGVTDWRIARNFIESFAVSLKSLESTIDPGVTIYEAYFQYGSANTDLTSQNYRVRNNSIEMILTAPVPGLSPLYGLTNVLSAYGQPDDVWLRTLPEPYNGFLPMWLVIGYSKSGFLVSFEEETKLKAGTISACFDEAIPVFWLWPAERHASLCDIARTRMDFSEYDLLAYRRLEEVTTMDAAALYQASRANISAICLETEASLWSLP